MAAVNPFNVYIVGGCVFLWVIVSYVWRMLVLFRGCHIVNLDTKGRLAVPSVFRAHLGQGHDEDKGLLILTLSPFGSCLWLYPYPQWASIEQKLNALSDFEPQSRRTKEMMLGHATDCRCDGNGRVLIPQPLRDCVDLERKVVFVGQGNKFSLWSETVWTRQRERWQKDNNKKDDRISEALLSLTL